MVLLGTLEFAATLVDKITAPLKELVDNVKNATVDISRSADSFFKLGAGLGGVGLALSKLSPSFSELGRLMLGAGAGVGAFATVLEAPRGIITFADSLQNLGKSSNIFSMGIRTASGEVLTLGKALTIIQGVLIKFSPLLLAIAGLAFVLYTLWTENFAGIQQAVYNAFGGIGSAVWSTIEFLKGIIIGMFTATKPIWDALIFVINSLADSFRAVGRILGGTSNSAFLMGKALGFVLSPLALLVTILGIYKGLLLTTTLLTKGFALAQSGLAVATKLATAATWLFNTALLANPVVWIVALIVGLIAGLVLLVRWLNSLGEKGKIWKDMLSFMFPIIKAVEFLIEGFKKISEWWDRITSKKAEAELTTGLGYEGLGAGPVGGVGFGQPISLTAIPGSSPTTISNRSASISTNVYTGPISSSVDVGDLSYRIAKDTKRELESIS